MGGDWLLQRFERREKGSVRMEDLSLSPERRYSMNLLPQQLSLVPAGKYTFLLFIFLFGPALGLFGCGSSSGPQEATPDFVRLDQYNIDTSSVALDKGFVVNWHTAFSSPSSIYTFEWHVSPQSSTSSDTIVLTLNCGPATQPCSNSGEAFCDYKNNAGGLPSVICSLSGKVVGQKIIPSPGKYVATGRACIFNSKLETICDGKDVDLTFD